MLKLVIVTVLFAHGVGHLLFLAPTLRLAQWADQTGHSWLAEPVVGDGLARGLGAVIWVAAIVLFIAAAAGLALGADWWRFAAIAGAGVSLAGIVAFWGGIAPGNAFFALAVDVITLIALLWSAWQSTELVGS